MMSSYEELKQISRSQRRQQVALIVLSVVLAVSTIVTWKSVAAMREANEIQKQILESRKARPAPKAALRRSNPGSETQARAEPHRQPGSTHPSARKRMDDPPAAIDSAPAAPLPSTRALPDRPGRQ